MAQKTVNGQTLEVPDFDSKEVRVKIGTILRLLFLIAAYVNQMCEVLGAYDAIIPEQYRGLITVVSLIATAVASVAAYWFNNSWTEEATTLDMVLSTMKFAAKYCPEIKNQIKENITDAGKLNVELALGDDIYNNIGLKRTNPSSADAASTTPVVTHDKMQN